MILGLHPSAASPPALRYAFRWHWTGWPILALGASIVTIVQLEQAIEPFIRLLYTCLGSAWVIGGILIASWRHELILRPDHRRYEYRRGLSWSLGETRGDLEEIEAIGLVLVTADQEGDRMQPRWELAVRHPRWPDPEVVVDSIRDRSRAWSTARELAIAIRAPLEEFRDGTIRRWTVEQLEVDATWRNP